MAQLVPKSATPATRVAPGVVPEEVDYVVVGAGSAGCVLAHRLSEDGQRTVLLLEAGGPEPEPKLDEAQLMGSRFDWKYFTAPEPQLKHRRINWPRGKVFGGSSSISSMMYHRGHRSVYDRWRSLGNPGWSYAEVLPYFKKSEANRHFHDEFHGSSGPLSVELLSDGSALKAAFEEAARGCGFPADRNWDFNGATQEGVVGIYQKTLRNGESQSSAAAFLVPILERPNLTARPWSFVTRLLWEGRRAVAVEYVANDWELHAVRARREVILCAGAVDTPHLLMLSGVGPAEELRQRNVPVVVDLPGVGRNLQDHLQISFMFKPGASAGKVQDRLGTNGLFLRSTLCPSEAAPDLQLFAFEVVVREAGFGLQPGPLYFITACLVQPRSVGSVTLGTADPLAVPVIRANYLQSEYDLSVLMEGAGLARRLAGMEPLKSMLEAEVIPGPNFQSHAELRGAIRQFGGTNFHPVGTCKMGEDEMAVVDAQLRVHGVEGLRVADASIMPTIVNANTNAPCIMIGEKAADLIRRYES